MKEVIIEKIYKDKFAVVRDNQVAECLFQNSAMKIVLKEAGQYMILYPFQLKLGNTAPEEYGDEKKYKLVHFLWLPTTDQKEDKKKRLIDKLGIEWYEKLGAEFDKDYMVNLSQFIATRRRQIEVFPSTDNLFNAFKLTPYNKVKVVMIGQDPYHSYCKDGKTALAHGLAFSAQDGVTCAPSLEVMFKEIENDIKFGLFLDQNYNLTYWAEQGILLINTILTVDRGKALSHEGQGWEIFTDEVIKALNSSKERIIFVLWGKKAQGYRERRLIDTGFHIVLEAPHPAAEAYREGAGFYGCKHFSKINEHLVKFGKEPINW